MKRYEKKTYEYSDIAPLIKAAREVLKGRESCKECPNGNNFGDTFCWDACRLAVLQQVYDNLEVRND